MQMMKLKFDYSTSKIIMEKKLLLHLTFSNVVFWFEILSHRDALHFCKKIFMNQEAILQSNLLDIIFENRNKDYGAYTLRKFYNNRLNIAVFSMIGAATILSIFLLSQHSPFVLDPKIPDFVNHDQTILNYKTEEHPGQKKAQKIVLPVKKMPEIERPPRIVADNNINKPVATPIDNIPSISPVSGVGNSSLTGNLPGDGTNGNGTTLIPETPKPNKSTPAIIADVMPQYPGGIPALLAFLKKNIQSPEDIDNGDEIKVEVRFVVNYNGRLESFDVVKSGGAAFDNEVLRVLKKMPLWTPGKTNGENVSVYFEVPVKFTSGFQN